MPTGQRRQRYADVEMCIRDRACSKVSLRGFRVPDGIFALEESVTELSKEIEEEICQGNMTEASLLRKERDEAAKKLEQIKKRFHKRNEDRTVAVTEEDIAGVVSQWTKIPVQKLAESELSLIHI